MSPVSPKLELILFLHFPLFTHFFGFECKSRPRNEIVVNLQCARTLEQATMHGTGAELILSDLATCCGDSPLRGDLGSAGIWGQDLGSVRIWGQKRTLSLGEQGRSVFHGGGFGVRAHFVIR